MEASYYMKDTSINPADESARDTVKTGGIRVLETKPANDAGSTSWQHIFRIQQAVKEMFTAIYSFIASHKPSCKASSSFTPSA